MEMVEADSSAAKLYSLNPNRISNEDILFCIDIGPESLVEMKSTGPGGKPSLDWTQSSKLFLSLSTPSSLSTLITASLFPLSPKPLLGCGKSSAVMSSLQLLLSGGFRQLRLWLRLHHLVHQTLLNYFV
ncbi:hypothetical protein NC652_038882 [Populus alba x Populus x berolinensis]|nr:hypothetical protein NC652_038882 [Populus alba x Populus x berolinensis]